MVVLLGMHCDKSRWVKPASVGTNSLHFPAQYVAQTAFVSDI